MESLTEQLPLGSVEEAAGIFQVLGIRLDFCSRSGVDDNECGALVGKGSSPSQERVNKGRGANTG